MRASCAGAHGQGANRSHGGDASNAFHPLLLPYPYHFSPLYLSSHYSSPPFFHSSYNTFTSPFLSAPVPFSPPLHPLSFICSTPPSPLFLLGPSTPFPLHAFPHFSDTSCFPCSLFHILISFVCYFSPFYHSLRTLFSGGSSPFPLRLSTFPSSIFVLILPSPSSPQQPVCTPCSPPVSHLYSLRITSFHAVSSLFERESSATLNSPTILSLRPISSPLTPDPAVVFFLSFPTPYNLFSHPALAHPSVLLSLHPFSTTLTSSGSLFLRSPLLYPPGSYSSILSYILSSPSCLLPSVSTSLVLRL